MIIAAKCNQPSSEPEFNIGSRSPVFEVMMNKHRFQFLGLAIKQKPDNILHIEYVASNQ
jgi:hypothetical protein